MGISVVLLAKHEAKNLDHLLPLIVENIKKLGEEYEIIVVDGVKTEDNTPEICTKFNVKYYNQEENNFGSAYKTAIELATNDKFLTLDCDNSHPPEKIPELYNKFVSENCDIVIGSRYVQGGTTNDNFISIIMSHLLNNTFRFIFNIPAKDLSAGFRIYKTNLLKSISIEGQNFDVMQEIIIKMRIAKPNLKIAEIPINFNKRLHGKSHRNLPLFIFTFIFTLIKLFILETHYKIKMFFTGGKHEK